MKMNESKGECVIMSELPRGGAKRFEDVGIWQKAHQWVLEVYKFSGRFPRHELFGLVGQLRRAAVSIPANFAEGFKKRWAADKLRFYNISQGSIEECRYYLILAKDLGYGDTVRLANELDEVSRMLDSYIRVIRRDQNTK
jgi:four helix bundle protein